IDLILNPSASHFAFNKQATRRRIVMEGSRAFGVAYVYANALGNESGRMIYDGGTVIASEGRLVAQGQRFSYADYTLTDAVVDVDTNRMLRAQYGSHRPNSTNDSLRIEVHHPIGDAHPVGPTHELPSWEHSAQLENEEFLRAVSLGLFDYLRKSRSRGFVLSLSGGADSSTCAILVRALIDLSVAELGFEKAKNKLGMAAHDATTPGELCHSLLTCVYQSTRNSGDVTRSAAETLAQAIGARYHEVDVDSIVQSYRSLAEGALGRALDWESDDIALQNIQSRVRAPSVWMLANTTGSLLLSTSNRSEAAVGYATMDGDTSGGLAPVAGIDKAFVRAWLRWMETDGGDGLEAYPALASVNEQAPTAELRPAERKQTDEEDLMPYPVLDTIEGLAIRDKFFPREVFVTLEATYPDASAETRLGWVERFFRLWSRNQWKRERYAPSFHVDDKNLDPKTWCRFPILSAGFEDELRRLREEVTG
ncbi:MAG: NAD(+) synthase, partial [Myxococcota bacterium]